MPRSAFHPSSFAALEDVYKRQLQKIAQARRLIDCCSREILLEVDGNVSFENAARMSALGANIFVAGTSSLYDRGGSVAENCRRLRQAIAVDQ